MDTVKAKYFDRAFFLLLVLMIGSFFFSIALNAILVSCLFLLLLVDPRNDREVWTKIIKTKRNIFLLIIFLSLTISVIYSEDKQKAWKGVFGALPLVILPISLYRITFLSGKKIVWLKRIYIISCFVLSIITLVRAGIRSGLFDGSYQQMASPDLYTPYFIHRFTYHQLSPGLHAVFFSLYVSLTVFFIIEDLYQSSRLRSFILVILLLYFSVYLLLLYSLTINFALYSFLIVYFFFNFSFRKWQEYIFFFFILIIGTFATWYLYILKGIDPTGNSTYLFDSITLNRQLFYTLFFVITLGSFAILIKLTLKRKYRYIVAATFCIIALLSLLFLRDMIQERFNSMKENNIGARFIYGNAAIKTIRHHPLLGIGIGDKKNEGIIDIKDLPAGSLKEHTFNAHNQFLDLWLTAGIIPLIFFILFLYNEFAKALQRKHFAYIGLVYCFCIFCFIDLSMMVQRGQIFFLFFICLFANELTNKKSLELNI